MKVKMLKTQRLAGEVFSAGSFYDIPEGQAKTWIAAGIAEKAPTKKGKEVKIKRASGMVKISKPTLTATI